MVSISLLKHVDESFPARNIDALMSSIVRDIVGIDSCRKIADYLSGAGRSSGSLWLLPNIHSAATRRMEGEPQKCLSALPERRTESAQEAAAAARECGAAGRTS
jgi:hypothetical protein